MTPDEVVTNLEANIEHHNCRNDDQSSCAYCQNTISAISLIQDYQKLRERVSEEGIERMLEEASTFTHTPPNYLTPTRLCFLPTKEIRSVVASQIVTYLQQPTEPIER